MHRGRRRKLSSRKSLDFVRGFEKSAEISVGWRDAQSLRRRQKWGPGSVRTGRYSAVGQNTTPLIPSPRASAAPAAAQAPAAHRCAVRRWRRRIRGWWGVLRSWGR